MKKNIIAVLLIISVTLGCFSGCIEEKKDDDVDNEDTFDGNIYTWTIQRFMEDQNIQGNITAWQLYKTGVTLSYDTLEDKDRLIIKDKIPEDITYDPEEDITWIPFTIGQIDEESGGVQTIYSVPIKGDITDDFTPGADFTLTVHIKHINVTAENFMGSGESIKLDWKIFQEQLNKDEDFFKTSLTSPSGPFDEAIKPMEQSVIERDHT